jgi:hypothetical protein
MSSVNQLPPALPASITGRLADLYVPGNSKETHLAHQCGGPEEHVVIHFDTELDSWLVEGLAIRNSCCVIG